MSIINATVLANWATADHLDMNLDYIEVITVRFYFYAGSLENQTVQVSGKFNPVEASGRDLRVIFDPRLTGSEQVKSIFKRANAVMYRLHHFRRITNVALGKNLVQRLLFRLVNYCSLVSCYSSNECNLQLKHSINTEIHYVYRVRKSSHITPYRKEFGLFRLATRGKFFAC